MFQRFGNHPGESNRRSERCSHSRDRASGRYAERDQASPRSPCHARRSSVDGCSPDGGPVLGQLRRALQAGLHGASPGVPKRRSCCCRRPSRPKSQGRVTEALVLYDSVASGRQVDKTTRTEALAYGATLRLSTDPARRDLTKAQTMLAEVTRLDPQFTTPVPVTTLAAFLQDVQALRSRANELDTALRTRERQRSPRAPTSPSNNSSRSRRPPPCATRTVSSAKKSKPSRPSSRARKKPCAAPPRNSSTRRPTRTDAGQINADAHRRVGGTALAFE